MSLYSLPIIAIINPVFSYASCYYYASLDLFVCVYDSATSSRQPYVWVLSSFSEKTSPKRPAEVVPILKCFNHRVDIVFCRGSGVSCVRPRD
jgi:hypothetical protein